MLKSNFLYLGACEKNTRHAMLVGGILWPYFSIRVDMTLQLSIIQVEVERKRVMHAYIRELEEYMIESEQEG